MEIKAKKSFTCYNCKQKVFDSSILTKVNNVYYCQDCLNELFYYCENCQDYYDKEDCFSNNNGNYYCNDCFNEKFFSCESCGNSFLRDNAYSYNNELYCNDCFIEKFFICENCENTFLRGNSYQYNGNYYCEDCFNELFSFCEICNEYYYRDDVIYNDDDASYYCESCYNENVRGLINSYSYKPQPIFAKEKYENTLFIGFELEIETENKKEIAESLQDFLIKRQLENRFYFKDDGSIDGFEVVSHPATLKKFHTYNLKSILDYLIKLDCNSYNNKKCGLHFHVNKSFFSKKEINKIGLFFYNCKNQIKKFSQRKDFYYCKIDDNEYDLNIYKKNYNYYNDNRYSAVNLQNKSTIEIRVIRGTLSYKRFLASLQFIDALSNFVKDVSALSLNWNCFTDYLRLTNRYNHLEKYLKEKNLMLIKPF